MDRTTPDPHSSEKNLHAMRLGPGKHLKGLTLMNGIVKPEEFDYFRMCSRLYLVKDID